MTRRFHPISPVAASDTVTQYQAPVQTAPTPQPTPSPANDTQPASTAPAAGNSSASTAQNSSNQADLQKYLDSALKNSGVKAEISFVQGGYSVVRLVQQESGQVLMQMPSQTVLSIIETMGEPGSSSPDEMPVFPSAGGVINQFA